MQHQKVSEFIDSYSRLLTQVWCNEEYSRRLDEDPRAVLSEFGLIAPHEATLQVMRDGIDKSDLGISVDLWNQGFSTGSFILYVPHVPRDEVCELSEADLGDLAGGIRAALQFSSGGTR